ncbi:MAG: hypothetical protein KDB52_08030 [Solirubrobacterales bacterium]|nr:hypothetical protein [Solirubrobacterales bacterium]
MKDLKASTIIAWVALFIAVGGTATAASGLINGSKIKPGTVTAKQIKNKTITTGKLSPATVASLKGAQGPVGPAGATGPAGANGQAGTTGATGATGSAGIVDPEYTEILNYALPQDEYPVPLSLDVVSGTYMITAKANVISQKATGLSTVECSIWTDETGAVDRAMADLAFNQAGNLSLIAVAPVEGLIELRCHADTGSGAASDLKLSAVPVQG